MSILSHRLSGDKSFLVDRFVSILGLSKDVVGLFFFYFFYFFVFCFCFCFSFCFPSFCTAFKTISNFTERIVEARFPNKNLIAQDLLRALSGIYFLLFYVFYISYIIYIFYILYFLNLLMFFNIKRWSPSRTCSKTFTTTKTLTPTTSSPTSSSTSSSTPTPSTSSTITHSKPNSKLKFISCPKKWSSS